MTFPRDYTAQEMKVAEVLDSTGLRYETQAPFGKYTVDFYIAEIDTVVEADGVMGHLRKKDRERDADLKQMGIENIIHIRSTTKTNIKEEVWQALNSLGKNQS
jgi:very-short-patch-repair endonuclease|tara:strand:- start:7702 stop:8010 length:309 start_codon:yes stop_codon:yes gene_type:complete